jgi:UDP-glucose 4-epimerase
MDRGRVITIFMGQLLRGDPLTVIGDGRQTRCFTYVDDAIRATVAAGLRPEAVGQVINVGGDEEVSIRTLAEQLIRLSGSLSTIQEMPQEAVYGQGYEDIPRRVPDTRRMKRLLGVTAEVPLEEGLRRTIEWFKESRPGA